MSKQLEFILSHDGCEWTANGLDIKLRENDFHLLKKQIYKAIHSSHQYINNDSILVTLRFDMDAFPVWLHQYHYHYFNYSFIVNKQSLD
jgi:hypothetical protein